MHGDSLQSVPLQLEIRQVRRLPRALQSLYETLVLLVDVSQGTDSLHLTRGDGDDARRPLVGRGVSLFGADVDEFLEDAVVLGLQLRRNELLLGLEGHPVFEEGGLEGLGVVDDGFDGLEFGGVALLVLDLVSCAEGVRDPDLIPHRRGEGEIATKETRDAPLALGSDSTE